MIPRTRLDELTYSFEPERLGELAPGDCVRVTLRGKKVRGIVIGLRDRSPVRNPLPVTDVVERQFVEPELLALLRWVGRYYWARMGEVLNLALPAGICGYRPKPRKEVDPSQQVVCESGKAAGESPVAFSENRFAAYCSARAEARLELAASFADCRRKNGSVIVLLPREKVTEWLPQLAVRFGDALCEYHSGQSLSERKRAWRRIRGGDHLVIAGVRSAVFAPVKSLAGIVVVDEHSPRYKEDRRPKFHARDVAITRAKSAGCPVLLCDRTPSVETWLNLKTGTYSWLGTTPDDGLPEAAGSRRGSFVVDMHGHRNEMFSPRLERELVCAVETGSAILYVNRRGLSRHVVCQECGNVLACERCGVPLVLAADRTLSCGLCGRVMAAPESCPGCHGASFQFRAPGVELVAREVQRLVPGTAVVQISADSQEPLPLDKGTAVVGTRALFSRPWPALTRLVAAVCFDYDLVLPDFRSRERAFQTLFEMERRARFLGSRLVVQTWRPDDPAVRSAIDQDPAGFLDQELELRRQLGFPPARRLALVEFRGRDESRVSGQAERVARMVGRIAGADALGPVRVLKKTWGTAWRLMVRFERSRSLDRLLTRDKLETLGVEASVDVDPLEVT